MRQQTKMPLSGFISMAFLLFSLLVFSQSSISQPRERVDLNLILAIDCSYSVDATEFNLQIHGTAAAFTNPDVIHAITRGIHGKIAVSVIQYSGPTSHVVTVPWTIIRDQVDALKIAIAIKSQERDAAAGATSITQIINKAAILHLQAPYEADRKAIDISADGENNSGGRVEDARDRAVALGITINGLTILNEIGHLNYYFQNRVIGGTGAFVQISKSYDDFGEAIRRKLLREILGGGIS